MAGLGLLLPVTMCLQLALSAYVNDDRCQTLRTSITVTKEKTHVHNGHTVRLTCLGTVELNKCEGLCRSQVSPSVVHFPGLKKDCTCCRESHLIDRLVALRECYSGSELVPGQSINMYIREPAQCRCLDCAI